MVDKVEFIWMNGELIPWDQAQIHVLCHSLHYGLGCFEGIRAYKTDSGRSAVFGLPQHIKRLLDSAKIAGIDIDYDESQLIDAVIETLQQNKLDEAYIRPLAYLSAGSMGVYPANNPVSVVIAAWKWGQYLGEDAINKGIRAKISTFNRYQPNTMMLQGKLSGAYLLNTMAKVEAVKQGYEEAILLDVEGFIAEGSSENIFIVQDGKLYTTPLTTVLPGLTRKVIIHVAKQMGIEVIEQRFPRDRLYVADEAFFTGTAAEVTPIREVDDRMIADGKVGKITRQLQQTFFDIVKGKSKYCQDWLHYYNESK